MKKLLLYLMAVLYIVAGINHFWHPQFYLRIMPVWLPWHRLLVMESGLCEMLGGVLLLPVATRRLVAWFIIVLLIAIFPANIQMAVTYYLTHNLHLWIAIVRLPLQWVLIQWAYVYTEDKVRTAI